jgi:hypothetical protein
VSGDLTAIPALWVVRYPETGRLLIDESEEFIRGWSTTVPGSTVLRLDVPALLRAKEALGALCDAIDNAMCTNAEAVDAAVAEGRAALAALDTPADPTS